jgi:hypothetical protein
MQCVECGDREATVIWVHAAPEPFEDVVYGEPLEGAGAAAAALPLPLEEAGQPLGTGPGPTLCVECARRRYDNRRPSGSPTWDECLRRLE